jgi:hypothetical protein
MKMTSGWMLAAAVMLVSGLGSVAHGDVLDDALGGKDVQGPAPKQEDAKPARPAEEKPTRPKLPEMVSPEAAKTVDDQDLLNKLTGKSDVSGGEAKDIGAKMEEVMERMGQAETRLARQRDPGLVTQETQRRIMTDLDVMIEYAREQQKKGGQGKPQNSRPGQQKQESSGQQSGPGQPGGTKAATDSNMRPGSASTPESNGADIHETGTHWGDLPPRDRDLVAHGASEHYLPEYKEMINKYYQALAELGKASKR